MIYHISFQPCELLHATHIPAHAAIVHAGSEGGVRSTVRQIGVNIASVHPRAVVDTVDQKGFVAGHVIPAGGVQREHHGFVGTLHKGRGGLELVNRQYSENKSWTRLRQYTHARGTHTSIGGPGSWSASKSMAAKVSASGTNSAAPPSLSSSRTVRRRGSLGQKVSSLAACGGLGVSTAPKEHKQLRYYTTCTRTRKCSSGNREHTRCVS